MHFKLLYIFLVHSHLCRCSQVWAPQTSMLMMEVEEVQRRASRFICKNHELSYKERLTSLNLLPINYWPEYLHIFLKDVRAQKCSHIHIFFNLATQKGNDLLLPKRQKKNGGVTVLVFEIMRCTFRSLRYFKTILAYNCQQ